MKIIALILLCSIASSQCQDNKPVKRMFTADFREFAGDFYYDLAGGDGNVVYSPLSIYLSMGMLLGGSNGNTSFDLKREMKFNVRDNYTYEMIHKQMRKLHTNTVMRESPNILRVANALFLQQGYPVMDSYTELLDEYYKVHTEELNFADNTGSAKIINDWIANKTENLITDLVDPSGLGSTTRLVLTNAIYFKATWKYGVNESTQYTLFNKSDGSQVPATYFEQTGLFFTYSDSNAKYVAIPYNFTNGQYIDYLIVGLPSSNDFSDFNLNAAFFLRNFNLHNWEIVSMRVVLPEFEIRQEVNVKNVLGALDVFDPLKSDLSGISSESPLYVSDFVHEAFINVDREGTEAAAASAVFIVGRSAAGVDEFLVNRPFFFAIYNKKADVFTFMGKLEQPRSSS